MTRHGHFEEQEDRGGRKIYRLRWSEPKSESADSLTLLETRRGDFIRYLIQMGKISEFEAATGRA